MCIVSYYALSFISLCRKSHSFWQYLCFLICAACALVPNGGLLGAAVDRVIRCGIEVPECSFKKIALFVYLLFEVTENVLDCDQYLDMK